MTKAPATLKRIVVGRPMASGELEHTLLPKVLALPVFSSDPLSSVAYATQEIILVLSVVGVSALSHVVPISFLVASLLAIVVVSYRQTVRAYPSGGGAYIVAHDNLGTFAGLLAASALLIDYVLTVSVSTVAGVDAILSAAQALTRYRVELCIAFVLFVTLMNLRGTRESGTLFAIPTYGFVVSIAIMLATGFVRCLGDCPAAESSDLVLEPVASLTPFLLLRAFSAGTTALTGVEAISNGVPAFRYPQSKNAATTLTVMGAMAISMFLGISWLAHATNVHYVEDSPRTVVAQIAHAVFGGGPLFYLVQVMTAAILVLAANTAFQDFPRLSSILAQDRFMPRQFMNRGDRLVFSNGVVILAGIASLLIWVFDADLNRLIQLYLVGVFISFTLSQAGMVVHWRRAKERGWKKSTAINGFGALVTGVVLCVVVATKFSHGAWIVICAIPILMTTMRAINKHYLDVREQLAHPLRAPVDRRRAHQHMVVLVTRVDAATARAVGYVRSVGAFDLSAVTFDRVNCGAWNRLAPEIPLTVLPERRPSASAVRRHLRARRAELSDADFLTLVVPEVLRSRSLIEVVKRPALHRLKAQLLVEPGVQVLDVPLLMDQIDALVDQAHEPARNFACVLVAGVHNATLQAVQYAETLGATEIRGVTFALDPEQTALVGDRWLEAGIPHPLEIEDAPFRDIGTSLTQYVRHSHPDGISRVVTVVIPEFVVNKKRHQVLHGQTALIVKRRLLFEPGVVVVSVPYHLER
jgi:amino acid transporter